MQAFLAVHSDRGPETGGDAAQRNRLREEEAPRVGIVAARLAKALQASEHAERVFSAVIGTCVPRFHLHLFPRYPEIPADVRWSEMDEWDGGPMAGPTRLHRW